MINNTFNCQLYQTDLERKLLTPNGYLEKFRPNLIQLINSHKGNNWKIQFTMQIVFNSIKDPNDKRTLYVKTKDVEITTKCDTNKTVNELFDLLIQSCNDLSEFSRRNSNLILEGVESMNHNFNQTSKSGSYIESPDWIKNKKCTINPQNKNDNRCFQHAITVALNYKKN